MWKIAVVGLIALIIASQVAFVIGEWEQGIILELGNPKRVCKEPGVYFKLPMIQELYRFEKRILVVDVQPEEYITLDKKRVLVDSVSRWRISDPNVFYTAVREYRGARQRLNDIIQGRLREGVASHNFKEFIRAERKQIMEQVTAGAAEAAIPLGIELLDVRIRRLDLPDEVQASVFARMKAERERIAKRYRSEGEEKAREVRAEADKEKEIILAEAYRSSETIRGEGDATAAAIYAQAYGQDQKFYSFFRHMEVYRKAFGNGATIVLGPESDLIRFLGSPGSKPAAGGQAR
jgi:membrane protease subunit HflC